jgi:hypothetical protein
MLKQYIFIPLTTQGDIIDYIAVNAHTRAEAVKHMRFVYRSNKFRCHLNKK